MTDRQVPAAADERIALLEDALEATQNGILVLDPDRRIVRYNRQFLKLLGLKSEDIAERGIQAIIDTLTAQLEDPSQMLVSRPDIWANPELEVLGTIRFKDGRVHERFIGPRRNGDRIIGRVVSVRDITSTFRTAQSQRLEAIGRLAGGIAHDLNNSLTAIIGYAELAMTSLDDSHPASSDVEEIRRAASRAESVTKQLLAFSRKQVLEPRVFSLADSVHNLGRMLERLLGAGVSVTTMVPNDIPSMYGDPGQIEQAILNIAVNARDAMPAGGRLTFTLSTIDADDTFVRERRPMRPGRYIQLLIADTGQGMSADIKAHIFEPFFTTKDVGKGTGLGLAMVYGTVKQSGGYVFVDSEIGHGTVFELYFPPAPAAAAEKVTAAEPAASTTILVAEDESPVRNLVVTALRRKGYQVLHASSADDALAIAASEGRPIDVLLTDAMMPGMGGVELAGTLLRERPKMAVVVMTGHTNGSVDVSTLGPHAMVLPKPFTPRELQKKIGDLLILSRAATT